MSDQNYFTQNLYTQKLNGNSIDFIFDVGGVLIDWRKSIQTVATTYKINPEDLLDEYFKYADKMFSGDIDKDIAWQHIFNNLKVDVGLYNLENINILWTQKANWISQSVDFVNKLIELGHNVHIMTNSWLELDDLSARKQIPINVDSSRIYGSSKLKTVKPEQKFYEIVDSKVSSNNTRLLIDDSIKNKDPALELGWDFFFYDTKDLTPSILISRLEEQILI